MSIDIERLKTDSAYWRDVAPKWADSYIIDENGDNPPAFHKSKGDRWVDSNGEFWPKGSSNIQVILRPTKPAAPEWDGEGLPPVGTIVEYASSDEPGDAGAELWKEGDEIEILAHKTCGAEGVAVVWNITVQEASQRLAEWKGKAVFRPIRTKEQRERDELAGLIDDAQMSLGSFWTPQKAAEIILSRYNLEPKQ